MSSRVGGDGNRFSVPHFVSESIGKTSRAAPTASENRQKIDAAHARFFPTTRMDDR